MNLSRYIFLLRTTFFFTKKGPGILFLLFLLSIPLTIAFQGKSEIKPQDSFIFRTTADIQGSIGQMDVNTQCISGAPYVSFFWGAVPGISAYVITAYKGGSPVFSVAIGYPNPPINGVYFTNWGEGAIKEGTKPENQTSYTWKVRPGWINDTGQEKYGPAFDTDNCGGGSGTTTCFTDINCGLSTQVCDLYRNICVEPGDQTCQHNVDCSVTPWTCDTNTGKCLTEGGIPGDGKDGKGGDGGKTLPPPSPIPEPSNPPPQPKPKSCIDTPGRI